MTAPPEPNWLARWRCAELAPGAGLSRFDALPAAAPADLTGDWHGRDLPTGHPLDGVLEGLGWRGKTFLPGGAAHPLVFGDRAGGRVLLDPAGLPLRTLLRLAPLARTAPAQALWPLLRRALRTTRPAARIEMRLHRGLASAAMVYDRQPITDHLRRIDAVRLLGLMEMTGMAQPFFFLLERADRP